MLEEADKYFRKMLRTHPEAPRVVDYLKARGLTGVVARDFGIGFAPPGWDGLKTALAAFGEADLVAAGLLVKNEQGRTYDRFRDRVTFPIRNTARSRDRFRRTRARRRAAEVSEFAGNRAVP